MKNRAAIFAVVLAACGEKVTLIDAPDAMEVCDPLAQTGCLPGEKCAWIVDVLPTPTTDGVGHIGCAADGTIPIDGACQRGVGASPCKAGPDVPEGQRGECVNGICKQICDHTGMPPQCDQNHACSRYSNLFQSGTATVAGVCDVRCDPLTQELVLGVNRAACGSQNAAAPTDGCYTFDNIAFTCAGIPMPARGLTDRMRAFGPPAGGVYVNGCAAGYLPFFIEETGSMIGICAGICAPLKTDRSVRPDPAVASLGSTTVPAKLHNQAAPVAGDGRCVAGKKGSATDGAENCHFLWWYNVENNMLKQSPYNDTVGLCFAHNKYTVDLDMNMQTPRDPFPKCQDLYPKGTANCPGAGCPYPGALSGSYGTADDWPCIPSTEAIPREARSTYKHNPAARDFRVGAYGDGPGLRHVLR